MSEISDQPFAVDLFNQGQLSAARAEATQAVGRNQADAKHRWVLAKLLCFTGEYDRADTHLKVILQQDSELTAEVLLFRNLLRAQIARQKCFSEGHLPSFTAPPPERLQSVLNAIVHWNDGDYTTAAELLQAAIMVAPAVQGRLNGERFDGFFDWDEFTATFFEVFSTNGDYYWIPFEAVAEISFAPITDIRDVLWRPASLTPVGGDTIEAYFPALYLNTELSSEDAMCLGRVADWKETGGVRRGVGARGFAVGDEGHANLADILQLALTAE